MHTCRNCGGNLNISQKGAVITCPYCNERQPHPAATDATVRAEEKQQAHHEKQTVRAAAKRHLYKNGVMFGVCVVTQAVCALIATVLFPFFSPQLATNPMGLTLPMFLLLFFSIGLVVYAVVNALPFLLSTITFFTSFTALDPFVSAVTRVVVGAGCALALIGPVCFFETDMAQNLCILLTCSGFANIVTFIMVGYRKTPQNCD